MLTAFIVILGFGPASAKTIEGKIITEIIMIRINDIAL
jgi:hypothetical protein